MILRCRDSVILFYYHGVYHSDSDFDSGFCYSFMRRGRRGRGRRKRRNTRRRIGRRIGRTEESHRLIAARKKKQRNYLDLSQRITL
jgi:hypothetical protein